LFRDHALLEPVPDHVTGVTGYRPLGGGVEFGERASEAVVREFREEISREVEVVSVLGVHENLFTYRGNPHHEVVYEHVVRFAAGYEVDSLTPLTVFEESADPQEHEAFWVPLAELLAGTYLLYPEGLADRVAKWLNSL
jgi:ADP-ribose pyrophosphatase YjhB (NUDIX family)